MGSSYRVATIPPGEGWIKPPDKLSTRECPTCKRELALHRFMRVQGQGMHTTRRCNRCIDEAMRSPGGLLGYRNPR